jgi:hypothetical protein|nr:MAG TPA: hypothetical protein [Caudoviricetes sp.]
MKVKEICNIIGRNTPISIYLKIQYSGNTSLVYHIDTYSVEAFKEILKDADSLANTSVDGVIVRDNILCIWISGQA